MAAKAAQSIGPRPPEDWRGESDHRTLMDAQEIQQDAGRMRGVRKQQRKKMKALVGLSRRIGRGRG